MRGWHLDTIMMRGIMRARLLLATTACLAAYLVLLAPSQAFAFALKGQWSNTAGSLVATGERGLGGGLEYAVSDDFCSRMLPRLVDRPRPTCNQVQAAIDSAFERWKRGSSTLRFTNVTGQIRPVIGESGAEIDVFAGNIQDIGGLISVGEVAFTDTYYQSSGTLVGTNGFILPDLRAIAAADIFIMLNHCYRLDSNARMDATGCNQILDLP